MAIDYAGEINRLAREFPRNELYALASLNRRSAISLSAVLDEGNDRNAKKDFKWCIEIAFGSLMEPVSHTVRAHRQQFLNNEDCNSLCKTADRLARMLSGLRRGL